MPGSDGQACGSWGEGQKVTRLFAAVISMHRVNGHRAKQTSQGMRLLTPEEDGSQARASHATNMKHLGDVGFWTKYGVALQLTWVTSKVKSAN